MDPVRETHVGLASTVVTAKRFGCLFQTAR
jgi:hypothetical protein